MVCRSTLYGNIKECLATVSFNFFYFQIFKSINLLQIASPKAIIIAFTTDKIKNCTINTGSSP